MSIKQTYTFQIDPMALRMIRELAAAWGVSIGEVMRRAIGRSLVEWNPKEPRPW